MKLDTLRKRREFLRIRGGGRCATHAFVLETKQREDMQRAVSTAGHHQATEQAKTNARFGFTVTKRLGNAVRRNRIRRRLRAALSDVAKAGAQANFDYVLVARDAAYDMPYVELTKLLTNAFRRVHQTPPVPRKRDHRCSKSAATDQGSTHGSFYGSKLATRSGTQEEAK